MNETRPRSRSRRPHAGPLLTAGLVLVVAAACVVGAAPKKGETVDKERWEEIERLISEDKMQQAAERAGELRADARELGDEGSWTRALIREVQLKSALHSYETAVRFLRDEPWPSSPRHRLVLHLFYGQSLVRYLQSYSWEIGRRERVETGDEVDLKAWTREQIVSEAQRAYSEAWDERDGWGAGPIGSLAEHIEQNNYPARIRGTLRDAVTYLWVELLADTSQWSAAHSNEIYRLDLGALLAEEQPAVDLAAPAVHPLAKIAALCADLEAWHRGHDRPEAALEARLERLRRLRGSFSQADDRQLLREDLAARLDELGSRFEWWSMGMASSAEMVRDDPAPDSQARARRIAEEGERAHPGSVGGRRCRHLAAAIAAPSYSLQAMASDGPGRRSIQVRHKNLESLHFRAYALDLAEAVLGAEDHNLLPAHREAAKIMATRRLAAEWTAPLPPTPDYRSHTTYVTPPLESPGLYLVVSSARQDFAEDFNQRTALNFIVSDLVLLTRADGGALEVTARSGASGAALADVRLSLYRRDWRGGPELETRQSTGVDGTVRFPVAAGDNHQRFLLAELGGDVTLSQSLWNPNTRRGREPHDASLTFTDRSVYRPGQTVQWKVVAYRRAAGEDSEYSTLPGKAMQVELLDANGELVDQARVVSNDFGSASGTFAIPAGRLLGSWQLRVAGGSGARIRVEEYKRPTFEVEIDDPEEALRLNREATLGGNARYYFGLPVTGGAVDWRVVRVPIYPRWWWWDRQPTQIIAAGDTELDADGTFRLSFTPEADERLAESQVSYRYRLSVEVTDEGGETRGAERSFRLGFRTVEATVESAAGFVAEGEAARLTVRRSSLDGVPRAGAGSWRLLALAQPERALLPAEQPLPPPPPNAAGEPHRTPGDALRPRWESGLPTASVLRLWDDGEQLRSGEVEHGEDGEAAIELAGLAGGAYRLRYRTRDDFGAEVEAAVEFLVAGDVAYALPAVLVAAQERVAVGEEARFFVHSGLADQELVLEISRGRRRVERLRFSSNDGPRVLRIPVDESYRGGFSVALAAVRDHQLLRLETAVQVPWDDRRLEVAFATFRDRLRPGVRETWRVTVRGADEAAVGLGAAEVLAYMYDRSLDVFAPHQPPKPLSLFPDRRGGVTLRSNLSSAGPVWRESRGFVRLPEMPRLTPDRLKFLDGYAIGGPGMRTFAGREVRKMRTMAMAAPPAPSEARAMPEAAFAASLDEAVLEDAPAESADLGAPAAPGEDGDAAEPPAVEVRSNFAETAFWEPHLLTGEDGSVSFELEVPDSVTEWNVWAHAVTRDLRSGSVERRTRTVKELLVRPYVPRFFREGDRAELEVVVSNAGETALHGRLDLEILDPESEASLAADFGLGEAAARSARFTLEPGDSTSLSFPVQVPRRVGEVAFRVVAAAGDHSDGELRPLPVLPSRLHLAQSRFVTLRDADRRTMHFADLAAGDDPTLATEQLVVTLDAQLFYSVLSALPYLVNYPYECSEQTLNRFLSSGIVSSVFGDHPAVAAMAKELARRDTRLEPWRADDPNRRMALEETPWLRHSRGETGEHDPELLRVLDPQVARAERDAALAKLRQIQTSLGGFPWWPGGPPSPYMTLYLVDGFSRALEFEIDVPRQVVVRAWSYLHRHYVDELTRRMLEDECCWELITYLGYVLSNYPDTSWTGGVFSADDRRQMLEFSFRHWRQHAPRLKGYLALTLARAGRAEDAALVWDSVMDSAKTTQDEGTFWAPEDRSWLWYNDTIESHAWALRTLSELDESDERRHGLVQWLLLNKKLNHWKSTRATAEVIYSLVHYLQQEGTLAVREEATVNVGPVERSYTFEPERYTGRGNQLVLAGDEVDPATMSTIEVRKETPGFLFASATWHFATDRLPEEARGDFFSVERRYFRRVHTGNEWVLEPLAEGTRLAVGDQLEVQLSLRAKHAAEYVHLRDPRGAGFEPESTASRYRWDFGLGFYEEIRDSGTNFFFEWLPAGEYTFKYRLRASMAGSFRVGPATVQSMYAPELTAYSAGARVEIE